MLLNLGVPRRLPVLLDNGADVNLLYKEFTLPANYLITDSCMVWEDITLTPPTLRRCFHFSLCTALMLIIKQWRFPGLTDQQSFTRRWIGYNGYISSDGGYDHGALIPIIKSLAASV